MGMTMSEKILARAAKLSTVKAGQIVMAKVDKAMMDDLLGPRVEIADQMERLGAKIWDPERVIIISDHYTPPATAAQADIVKYTRDWSKAKGIKNYYEFIGPCHQIMIEKGHTLPGEVIVGTDSHSCSYGAVGAFATGIGSTEMLGVLMMGEIWLKVPETIRVKWKGQLAKGVMAKDLSLHTIKHIGHAGATYKTVEYVGAGIAALPMDERICIANMAVEMGAKAGLMEYDEVTAAYLKEIGVTASFTALKSDPNANFVADLEFDASTLVPQIACPHEVDNVTDIGNVKQKIEQAYLGSCTGGRYTDLKIAAEILKGRKVAEGIRLLVSAASASIYQQCLRDGIIADLAEAGAIILPATCGACLGLHSGTIGAGETCISATNRNFIGRMGSKKSFVYLGSPATVAASAITGEITDPREFL
ncbi:MAG TPA: 3-isopropylmalate dehydratase large subunit [Candidatus Avacidaminococcus intestinavium]|uniref:3-isopropylmalate dehydratase large subunit n=1 Tax=Candidatus Avacidaminococcus intestinavium TaxID=2840684 RepID=A0A9D1MPN2_9FIRM|nr:3-isopropylmalate dehydratase large subunit [Candidatus Avacidaminococcus intestinavium]